MGLSSINQLNSPYMKSSTIGLNTADTLDREVSVMTEASEPTGLLLSNHPITDDVLKSLMDYT